MSDLLVSIILAVCPAPDGVYTTPCMENIVNCAIREAGKITPESIKECVDQHKERTDEGSYFRREQSI